MPNHGTLNGLLVETLRNVRLDSGLHQRVVASRVKWDQGRIPLLERGKHAMNIHTFETWLRGLGARVVIEVRFNGEDGRERYRQLSFGKVDNEH